MKFFDDLPSSPPPPIQAVRNKLIRDREEKIREDIKRLEQLKKLKPDKVSRYDMLQIFKG